MSGIGGIVVALVGAVVVVNRRRLGPWMNRMQVPPINRGSANVDRTTEAMLLLFGVVATCLGLLIAVRKF